MNKAAFFDSVRHSLFGGKLRQGQVDTINEILAMCYEREVYDLRKIAYILATAYHEAYSAKYNPEFAPVREGFAKTDEEAYNHVVRLYKAGKIKRNYAKRNSKGYSYYGRGWVQITHEDNYKRLGDEYKIDLVNNPDLALSRPVAALLLVEGMVRGFFTGLKLGAYITDSNTDLLGSRKTVNGQDKASLIAGYAMKFYEAMIQL